jgi:alpha-N-arabinofuranosidase
MHISLVNIDTKIKNKVSIDLEVFGIKKITASILTSNNLQDHNTFENPNKIEPKTFKDFTIKKGVLEVNLPPFSIVTLEGKQLY